MENNISANVKVIGIVGHPAAGKDLAAEFFIEKKFAHISGGDFLRSLMKQKNIPTDREHIHNFISEMRHRYGNQYPAEPIAQSIQSNTVVSGFRNLAEIDVFRKKFGKGFILLAIDAPIELRYERIHVRARHGDDISFEKFKEDENKERSAQSGTHEMDNVIGAADHIIINGGTKDEFFKKLALIYPQSRRLSTGK